MDAYAEVLHALEIAVWPLVVLVLAHAFRKQIVQLFTRMTRARVVGVGEFDFGLLAEANYEGEFIAKEREATEEADPRVEAESRIATPDRRVEAETVGTVDIETTEADSSGQEEEEESTFDIVMSVARLAPQAAIMKAWTEVEMAIHAVRRGLRLRVHRRDVVRYLEKQGVLAETTASQYVRLRKLRDEAAHASERDIDVTAAQTYAKLAFQLAEAIRAGSKHSFDDTLCSHYKLFNVPSDQLVQNQELGNRFVEEYLAKTGLQVERQAILDRLIYLRKQGRLPTVRR